MFLLFAFPHSLIVSRLKRKKMPRLKIFSTRERPLPGLRATWQSQRVVNHALLSRQAAPSILGKLVRNSFRTFFRLHFHTLLLFGRRKAAEIQLSIIATRRVEFRQLLVASVYPISRVSSLSLEVRAAQLMRVAINRRDAENFKQTSIRARADNERARARVLIPWSWRSSSFTGSNWRKFTGCSLINPPRRRHVV